MNTFGIKLNGRSVGGYCGEIREGISVVIRPYGHSTRRRWSSHLLIRGIEVIGLGSPIPMHDSPEEAIKAAIWFYEWNKDKIDRRVYGQRTL